MSDEREAIAFNHHDARIMQNPYPFYSEVRRRCPVAHSEELGGFFFAVGYDSAKKVLSDFQNFTSTEGVSLPRLATEMYPVDLDPPLQTKFRKVLNRFFSPDAAEARRAAIQAIVDAKLDAVIQDGSTDIAATFTRPALNAIMLPLIGVPPVDQETFTDAIDYISNSRMLDQEEAGRKNLYIVEYLTALSARRRGSGTSSEDFVQFLIDEQIDGRHLDDDEICRVLLVTLFGALDTTHATLNEAILHLARNRADKQRLASGEVSWVGAIEEFVRYASPIQTMRRTATNAFVFEGMELKAGDPVLAFNGAANRDPGRFSEPDRCLLSRDARDHLGFGAGAHVCLGRNFARVIIDVVLKTMLGRIPDFAVPAGFNPSYTIGEGRRMKSLPLTYTPGVRL